jgi:hypothetical protein
MAGMREIRGRRCGGGEGQSSRSVLELAEWRLLEEVQGR